MFVIPADRLPPGFAERIEAPPAEPALARPAATAVLLRDGDEGLETLLMRRVRTSGFVPGAYVFPGGRVDEADGDPALLERVDGPPTAPDPAYWTAVLREVFEETGVLLARDGAGRPLPDAGRDARLAGWREALMERRATLGEVLRDLELRLALDDVVYFAHWITPLAESRRYDTRFFMARLPEGCEASADPREMTDALWLRPTEAVERFRAGRLPMVFPTVATLESLTRFHTVDDALAAWRDRPVRPILPRLVRTAEGVGIVVDKDRGP